VLHSLVSPRVPSCAACGRMFMRACFALLVACVLLGCSHAFKIPFYPANSTYYIPQSSSSFSVVPKQAFFLGYADNTHLKGFQARDVVQLGDHFTYTKFGAITECNSPDFNGVSGILGFGLPTVQPAAPPPSMSGGLGGMMGGGMGGSAPPVRLPRPLLFSLTDPVVKDNDRNKMLHRRAFSFLSTETAAEIQIGGYDPASVDGDMFITPSISMTDYVAVAMGLKFGNTDLVTFTSKDKRLQYLPAIMDSGTSCLVMPSTTLGGILKESPFDKWKAMIKDTKNPAVKETFHLNIGGATFDIPYETWFLSLSNQSCVQKTPPGFSGILVGDVLFRRYVVMFDLTRFPEAVLMGIAKRKADYVPGTKHPVVKKVAAIKVSGQPKGSQGKVRYKAPIADNTIPIFNKEETQYFINVSMGTPRQQFTVIFDTGSSVFGVFSQCDDKAPVLGRCMFGAQLPSYNVSLMHGVIMVVTVAFGLCLVGIALAMFFRRRHEMQERERLKEYKKAGGKIHAGSFGSEKIHGLYGSMA